MAWLMQLCFLAMAELWTLAMCKAADEVPPVRVSRLCPVAFCCHIFC